MVLNPYYSSGVYHLTKHDFPDLVNVINVCEIYYEGVLIVSFPTSGKPTKCATGEWCPDTETFTVFNPQPTYTVGTWCPVTIISSVSGIVVQRVKNHRVNAGIVTYSSAYHVQIDPGADVLNLGNTVELKIFAFITADLSRIECIEYINLQPQISQLISCKKIEYATTQNYINLDLFPTNIQDIYIFVSSKDTFIEGNIQREHLFIESKYSVVSIVVKAPILLFWHYIFDTRPPDLPGIKLSLTGVKKAKLDPKLLRVITGDCLDFVYEINYVNGDPHIALKCKITYSDIKPTSALIGDYNIPELLDYCGSELKLDINSKRLGTDAIVNYHKFR